jgi:hypothetical protein
MPLIAELHVGGLFRLHTLDNDAIRFLGVARVAHGDSGAPLGRGALHGFDGNFPC